MSYISEILLRFVIMKEKVLIVMLEFGYVFLTALLALLLRQVNEVRAAISYEYVADFALLLLHVIAESDAACLAKVSDLSLHDLELLGHDFHLIFEVFVLLGDVFEKVGVVLHRVDPLDFQILNQTVQVDEHGLAQREAHSAVQHMPLGELDCIAEMGMGKMFFIHVHYIVLLDLAGDLAQVLRLLAIAD